MGLEKNQGRLIFVNIKEGKLYIKPKDGEIQFFDKLSGTIIKVEFSEDEYQGKKYEKAKFLMVDGDDKYLLQVRTDSGYFRGLCNKLKSGDPTKPLKVSASYKMENDKPQTTCFVEQYGKSLKHTFTKDNPGDYPQLEKISFKGNDMWDGANQIQYWKNWLLSIKFDHEAVVSVEPTKVKSEIPEPDSITEPLDDLPF